MALRLQGFRALGLQGFRALGLQRFRVLGLQGFSALGFAHPKNALGIHIPRDSQHFLPSSPLSSVFFNGIYKNREKKTKSDACAIHLAAPRFKKMRFSKIALKAFAPSTLCPVRACHSPSRFRVLGLQGFRALGLQGFRALGLQGFRALGLQGFRALGLQGFRALRL